jgi:hypothetical protein
MMKNAVGKIADSHKNAISNQRVELDNGTKYDAYISFSLALLGTKKIKTEYHHQPLKKLGNSI